MAHNPVLHENLPILETNDRMLLDTLYADPKSSRFLLTRLSDTVAVIAPGQTESLQAYLLKIGQTPKVLE